MCKSAFWVVHNLWRAFSYGTLHFILKNFTYICYLSVHCIPVSRSKVHQKQLLQAPDLCQVQLPRHPRPPHLCQHWGKAQGHDPAGHSGRIEASQVSFLPNRSRSPYHDMSEARLLPGHHEKRDERHVERSRSANFVVLFGIVQVVWWRGKKERENNIISSRHRSHVSALLLMAGLHIS